MNLVVPILIPFLTALLCLAAWRMRRLQGWLTVGGMGVMLYTAYVLFISVRAKGIMSLQMGNWNAPFGITLSADLLSCIMLIMAALIGLAVSFYSIASVDEERQSFGFYPLFNFLIFGVAGAFAAGDIFNLYVWFEIMLISSFVMLALGGKKEQLEGSIKYVALNFLSSGFFLAGVAILYSITGTLNMAHLAQQAAVVPEKGLLAVASVFFLIAFGIKAAVFPLFFWLPASYHTPPVAVTAIFSGLLTKVGVYALIRMFSLIFVFDTGYTHTILMILSALTMIVGVLGPIIHHDFRRILSFHIVSQIGYIIMGMAIFSPLALAGSIFFIMHIILVKTNLFLISGIVHYLKGSFNLRFAGGIYRDYPWLAFLFLVPALALAGLPPFSGFWAKIILIKSAIDAELFWLLFIALGVSLLTLYSMTKIWNEVFWANEAEAKDTSEHFAISSGPLWMMALPVIFLVGCTLLIGLYPVPFFKLAEETALQLLNRNEYIKAILH
ncbi:MAG: Na+/H+ antiporter subunit D [Bacteroidetes bacterium]|nr:Na+/H+ antiporter subunit D [Bacteroidota bacterium]